MENGGNIRINLIENGFVLLTGEPQELPPNSLASSTSILLFYNE